MTHYGRPTAGENTPAENRDAHTAAGRILALGCALIAGFLISMTVPWQAGSTEEAFPDGKMPAEGVAAVMSTAVQEKENLARPENGQEKSAGTGADPFGYLDGEWNLWEYIGDLMWSLLS